MVEKRIRIAAGLLIGIASLPGSARANPAASVPETRYLCDGGHRLIVQRSATSANVRFRDRSYELQRRHSGSFEKYGAAGATLIIDGDAAVFVATDRLQLGQCVKESPTALAH